MHSRLHLYILVLVVKAYCRLVPLCKKLCCHCRHVGRSTAHALLGCCSCYAFMQAATRTAFLAQSLLLELIAIYQAGADMCGGTCRFGIRRASRQCSTSGSTRSLFRRTTTLLGRASLLDSTLDCVQKADLFASPVVY